MALHRRTCRQLPVIKNWDWKIAEHLWSSGYDVSLTR